LIISLLFDYRLPRHDIFAMPDAFAFASRHFRQLAATPFSPLLLILFHAIALRHLPFSLFSLSCHFAAITLILLRYFSR